MIDLERESLVTLAEAPRLIPAINAVPGMEARKPLHSRTIYNWATRGKRGVVLETVPVGGILVTTQQALQRFFSRLAALREQRMVDRVGRSRQHPSRRSTHNDTAYRAARERLASQHGI